MRKILISTNMYKGSEFGQVLPYLKRFPGQVGVEVFPMFHEALRRTCGTPCRS